MAKGLVATIMSGGGTDAPRPAVDDGGDDSQSHGSADSPVSIRGSYLNGKRSGAAAAAAAVGCESANTEAVVGIDDDCHDRGGCGDGDGDGDDDDDDDDSSWSPSLCDASLDHPSGDLETTGTGSTTNKKAAEPPSSIPSSTHSRSTAAGPAALGTVHVLLVCPRTRRFDLVLAGYDPDDRPTARMLLDLALERCEDGGASEGYDDDDDDDDDGSDGSDGEGGGGRRRSGRRLADASLYSGELCRPEPGAVVMDPSRPIATYGVGGTTGDDVLVAVPAGMSAFEAIELATPILTEHWGALLRRSRHLLSSSSDDDDDDDKENGGGGGGGGAASAKTLLKKASSLLADALPHHKAEERTSKKTMWKHGEEISLTRRRSVAWRGTNELVVDAGDHHDGSSDVGFGVPHVPIPKPLHEGNEFGDGSPGPWRPPHPKTSPRPPLLKRAASAPELLRSGGEGCKTNKGALSKTAAVAAWYTSISNHLSKVSDDGRTTTNSAAGSSARSNASRRQGRRRPPVVRFDSITIREYPMILGDHPNVSYGPPVSLGWDYDEYEPLSLDAYESYRPADVRRDMRQMMMNYYRRKNVLTFWAGYTEEEVLSATKSVKRDKRRRSFTLNAMPVSRCYETALGLKAFALGGNRRKARKGAEYYEQRVMAAVLAEAKGGGSSDNNRQ